MDATTTKSDPVADTRASLVAWGRAIAELDAAWDQTPVSCFTIGDEPSLNDARAALVEFRDALVARYAEARVKAGRTRGLLDELAELASGCEC